MKPTACNPRTWLSEQEGYKFEARLGYTVRLCQEQTDFCYCLSTDTEVLLPTKSIIASYSCAIFNSFFFLRTPHARTLYLPFLQFCMLFPQITAFPHLHLLKKKYSFSKVCFPCLLACEGSVLPRHCVALLYPALGSGPLHIVLPIDLHALRVETTCCWAS